LPTENSNCDALAEFLLSKPEKFTDTQVLNENQVTANHTTYGLILIQLVQNNFDPIEISENFTSSFKSCAYAIYAGDDDSGTDILERRGEKRSKDSDKFVIIMLRKFEDDSIASDLPIS
jgi:hypothetical protein